MKKYIQIAISFIAFLIIGSLVMESNMHVDKEISISEFYQKLNNNELSNVKIVSSSSRGKGYAMSKQNDKYVFYLGDNALVEHDAIQHTIQNADVKLEISNEINPFSSILMLLFSILPTLLFIMFLLYFWAGKSGGANLFFGEEKQQAKKPKTRFEDVQGVDEAKNELKEIVDFLKNPYKYQRIGANIPKGCLLVGEPGTGKTLMAKAIAGEAHVPFFEASGSEFIELFVGMGAKRVRELFEKAKKQSPCIIFIDEIDAIGKSRSKSAARSNDEADQTLNQILTEMDGFNTNSGIIIIGATNRPDILDKALLRPGRFDRRITIDLPDLQGRQDILKAHLKKVKHDESINVKSIAKVTAGMSGADLMNIINEAALMAARKGAKQITSDNIDEANDRVTMGLARKSTIMTDEDKKITAYHEAGHAILTYFSKYDKIHKVTIMPRGLALGMVSHVRDNDDIHMSKRAMEDKLAIAMAGRAAEELIFGHENITSGASSDIEYATRIAKGMVRLYGMNDKVGKVQYKEDSYISESKQQMIDQEITKLIDTAYKNATTILTKNKDKLEKLTQALLKHETLLSENVDKIMKKT